MGCVCSKKPEAMVAGSPVVEPENNAVGLRYVSREQNEGGRSEEDHYLHKVKSKKGSGSFRKNATTFSIKLGLSHRHVEAEQIAAGWPAWLTAAASEAVYGMVPLRAESFEKLDKVGYVTFASI